MSRGLMGLPSPTDGYNGLIQAGMTPIQVKDGHFSLGGRSFFVTKDGEVTDSNDKPVGRIVNGRLVAMQPQAA